MLDAAQNIKNASTYAAEVVASLNFRQPLGRSQTALVQRKRSGRVAQETIFW